MVLQAVIASLLLSFVISFDEFILAFFLTSSDQTLPMYMWGQMRFPKKLPHVLALGAVIILVTSLLIAGTDGTIRGRITDGKGEGLPGTQVYIPGTAFGTINIG